MNPEKHVQPATIDLDETKPIDTTQHPTAAVDAAQNYANGISGEHQQISQLDSVELLHEHIPSGNELPQNLRFQRERIFSSVRRMFTEKHSGKLRRPEEFEQALNDLQEQPITLKGKDYTVLSILGEGGLGFVLEVKELDTGETFALKLRALNNRAASAPQYIGGELQYGRTDGAAINNRMAIMETAISHRLSQDVKNGSLAAEDAPVIIMERAGAIAAPNNPYARLDWMLMERVDGVTLDSHLSSLPTASEVVPVMAQAIAGVEYMHNHGVYSRDIKANNFMFDAQHQTVKLMDFGLGVIPEFIGTKTSKFPSPEFGTTVVADNTDSANPKYPMALAIPATGIVLGTPSHMPEFAIDGNYNSLITRTRSVEELENTVKDLSEQWDKFSVGVMLLQQYNRILNEATKRDEALEQPPSKALLILGSIGARLFHENKSLANLADNPLTLEQAKQLLEQPPTDENDPTYLDSDSLARIHQEYKHFIATTKDRISALINSNDEPLVDSVPVF